MNEQEKVKVMIELGDALVDFLLRKIPDGIEKNQILIVKECKEVNDRLHIFMQDFGKECDDPVKVEAALKLLQDVRALLDGFLEKCESSGTKDKDDAAKELIERLFSE